MISQYQPPLFQTTFSKPLPLSNYSIKLWHVGDWICFEVTKGNRMWNEESFSTSIKYVFFSFCAPLNFITSSIIRSMETSRNWFFKSFDFSFEFVKLSCLSRLSIKISDLKQNLIGGNIINRIRTLKRPSNVLNFVINVPMTVAFT